MRILFKVSLIDAELGVQCHSTTVLQNIWVIQMHLQSPAAYFEIATKIEKITVSWDVTSVTQSSVKCSVICNKMMEYDCVCNRWHSDHPQLLTAFDGILRGSHPVPVLHNLQWLQAYNISPFMSTYSETVPGDTSQVSVPHTTMFF
jgi:hypothetical protein